MIAECHYLGRPIRSKMATTKNAKAAAKKPGRKKTVYADGITLYKNSKGIGVRIAQNGRILADMGGYNNRGNVAKGLWALKDMLDASVQPGANGANEFKVHEHPSMKPAKKAAAKKK